MPQEGGNGPAAERRVTVVFLLLIKAAAAGQSRGEAGDHSGLARGMHALLRHEGPCSPPNDILQRLCGGFMSDELEVSQTYVLHF